MIEIFCPKNLFCEVGQTQATVFVSLDDADLRDNVRSYVTEPCKGCRNWSVEGIVEVEERLKEEWGDQSGIIDGRYKTLEQLIMNRARLKGGQYNLVVGMCTPVTRKGTSIS